MSAKILSLGFTAALLLLVLWLGLGRNSVLHGTQKGAYASLVILLLVLTGTSWSIFRLSRRLLLPISNATKRINVLSNNLSETLKLPQAQEEVQPGSAPLEIRQLEKAIQALEVEFSKTEEMRRMVEEERSRSFTTSKMASLGEMAGGIAHEINSPLATISTLSSQLQELVDDETLDRVMLKDIAADIEKTSFRISKIVNGLRYFSRDESHDPYSATPLNKIVEDTLSFCSEKFKHRNIRLIVDPIPPDLKAECRGSELSQVILNLLSNACDAVEELKDRWVQLSVHDHGDKVQIQVTDSGAGIPANVQQKLFQPFFTTKGMGKGTGLGLGISDKIVKSHGGSLTIDRTCKNTRFVFSIPKVRMAATLRIAA